LLGCSRKAARFLTFRSSSRIWAELHEKAFRRLGGATRVNRFPATWCMASKNRSESDSGFSLVARLL